MNERFSEVVASETDALIDAFAHDRHAELKAQFAGPLATAITPRPSGSREPAPRTSCAGTARSSRASRGWRPDVRRRPRAARRRRRPRDAIGAVLDEHHGDSLLAAATDDADADALSRDQLISNAAVMLFGGIETTEGMIANAVRHLLLHEDALQATRADAALLPNAIEESLRLEPAAATSTATRRGTPTSARAHIKAGDMVTVSIASANRDPAVFPDPDTFDIRRENARLHVAFAHGPHVCIGMHLARLEAHTAVGRLLDRLPVMKLTDADAAQPRGIVFRKPPELRVRWVAAGVVRALSAGRNAVPHAEGGNSCPRPSSTSSFAPAISRASASPWASGKSGSSVPWITSAGAVISASRARGMSLAVGR